MLAALAAVGLAIAAIVHSEPAPKTAAQPPPVATPRLTAALGSRAGAAAISPDGRRCATLDREGITSLWSCADGKRLARSGRQPESHDSAAAGERVAFTRDGLAILATSGAETTVLTPTDLTAVERLRGPGPELAPTVSPSGSRAFRPLTRHSAEVVETPGERRIAEIGRIPHLAQAAVVFSRDDRALAIITRPRAWATVLDSSTGDSLNSFSLESRSAKVDLSAGGDRVLIGDRRSVRIMDVITGVERDRFDLPSSVSAAAYGVDERFVVAGSADGMVRVWDTATGAEIAAFDGGPGPVSGVSLAADGRLLVTAPNGPPIVLDCRACAATA